MNSEEIEIHRPWSLVQGGRQALSQQWVFCTAWLGTNWTQLVHSGCSICLVICVLAQWSNNLQPSPDCFPFPSSSKLKSRSGGPRKKSAREDEGLARGVLSRGRIPACWILLLWQPHPSPSMCSERLSVLFCVLHISWRVRHSCHPCGHGDLQIEKDNSVTVYPKFKRQ